MEYETKSLHDYIGIIRRQRMVLLTSVISISLIGVYVANAIPATYQSTSKFLIEQQDIPQEVVQSTVHTFVDEQIQAVRTRVMSSGNATRLIEEHDLYPEITATGNMQAAVDKLRNDTLLETEVYDVMNPRSGRPMMATISFTLSYDHSNAQTARDVAADLANLYLSENMESRTGQVEQTLEFIRGSIERYQEDVETTGKALADFMERNLGNLPEQVGHNFQTMERTERQIDSVDQEIRAAQNRQLELGSQLAQLENSSPVYDTSGQPILNPAEQLAALQMEKMRLTSIYSPQHPDVMQIQKEIDILSQATGGGSAFLATLSSQVEQARAAHAGNLQRYSPDHPDVQRSQRTLENLEAELAEARRTAGSRPQSTLSDDPYARQLQLQIDAAESTVRTLQQRRSELQSKLLGLESSVAMSPAVEREYELLRQRNQAATTNLNDARARLDEAQKAKMLETAGGGDRFTIIEPARVPDKPYKPNRMAIMLLAFVLACGVGAITAMVLDALDDTVKSTRDVMKVISMPPMAVIPYLETDAESRRRVLTNGLMVGSVFGAVLVAYLLSQMSA